MRDLLINVILIFILLRSVHCEQEDLAKRSPEERLKIMIQWQKEAPPPSNESLFIPEAQSKEAYMYMVCARPEVGASFNYMKNVFLNIIKLRHYNERISSTKRDILVVTCPFTSNDTVNEMKKLGAIVIVADPIIPPWKRPPLQLHWIDLFSKLHAWRLTQWERILYMDSDTTPFKNVHIIWDEQACQPTGTRWSWRPQPYVFAAILDTPCYLAPRTCAFWGRTLFNAGVFMLKPSMEYFNLLIDMAWEGSFDNDQDMLNNFYTQSYDSAWLPLPDKYNVRTPLLEEYPDRVIMHLHFWELNHPSKVLQLNFKWHNDWGHFYENLPVNYKYYDAVYTINDTILVNSTKDEAIALILDIRDGEENFIETFMDFITIQILVRRIMKDNTRDVIILVTETVTRWHFQQLQELGVIVARIQSIKGANGNAFNKLWLWNLSKWSRVLYLDSSIWIDNNNNNTLPFLKAWNETLRKETESSNSIIIHAARSRKSPKHFNTNIMLIRPSEEHLQLLLSISKDTLDDETNLLQTVHMTGGLYPWSEINSLKEVIDVGGYWKNLEDRSPIIEPKFWNLFYNLSKISLGSHHTSCQICNKTFCIPCSLDCQNCLTSYSCRICHQSPEETCLKLPENEYLLLAICDGNNIIPIFVDVKYKIYFILFFFIFLGCCWCIIKLIKRIRFRRRLAHQYFNDSEAKSDT